MKITDDTGLTTQAVMFADGDKGRFTQHHKLLADDEDTGVLIVITGNTNKRESSRTFITKSGEFNDYKQALQSAGHEVTRTK